MTPLNYYDPAITYECGDLVVLSNGKLARIIGEGAPAESNIPDKPNTTPMPPVKPPKKAGVKGWICPVCGRGVAPHVKFCPCTEKSLGEL